MVLQEQQHSNFVLDLYLQDFLNLDSLVDIVSNNVGILVILAVFMAMFSLLEKSEQVTTTEQPIEIIEKLKNPIEKTVKNCKNCKI